MERRKEPRTPAQQRAKLTILGREGAPPASVVLEDFAAHGVRLRAAAQVAVNTAVQIETDDLVILGDVCRCSPAENGGSPPAYYVAVKVAHRLATRTDLYWLNRALSADRQLEPSSTRS